MKLNYFNVVDIVESLINKSCSSYSEIIVIEYLGLVSFKKYFRDDQLFYISAHELNVI